jgi:DNA-directed RNA polymerase specialized sigma24 family protein
LVNVMRTTPDQTPEQGLASPDVAASALARLSAADLVRLRQIARLRASGLTGVDWEDLLQEAFSRILAGTRRWPLDVPLVAFVAQSLRSLASEHHRKQAAHPFVALDASSDPSGLPLTIADDRPGADQLMEAIDRHAALFRGLEQDHGALAVLSGYERGETADETMVRAGLTPLEYDAARKRFRRIVKQEIEREGPF